MRTLRSVVSWFMPVVPESRVAVLRTVLYLFVIIDIHLFVRDPIPLSRNPELYQPLHDRTSVPPAATQRAADDHALSDLGDRLSGGGCQCAGRDSPVAWWLRPSPGGRPSA